MALQDTLAERIIDLIPTPEPPDSLFKWPKDERDYYMHGNWTSITRREEKLGNMRRKRVAQAIAKVVMQEMATRGPYERIAPDLKFANKDYWQGARDAETWIMTRLGIPIQENEEQR